jgi:hypothetical protein
MTRTGKLLLVPVFLLQMLLFSFVARHRFIEGDEGFYLLASRLVLMHKKPYLDFFYTQTPLLPYVYAFWMKYTEMSWTSAKIFSALLTALLGTVLYEHVCHQTRNWLAGVVATIVFASSTLVFAFFTVVQTYSLAGLFLFSAYAILSRISAASPRWMIGTAGLLFGLSVDTRSYLLLLAPLFLCWIFHSSGALVRLTSILLFLSGFMIGIVPCLYFFMVSPKAFLFDNLGYHVIRSDGGAIGMWGEKLIVILITFLGSKYGNGIQNSMLFFICIGFIFLRRRKSPPLLAFQITVLLGVISLLPTPAYPQYFCLCVPFLVTSTVSVVNDSFTVLQSWQGKLIAATVCTLLLGLYLGASLSDLRRYLVTGDGVPGVQPAFDKGDWKLQRVIEVSRAVDQITSAGETVASFWPGDIFETKTNPFPGLESDFGLHVSEKLTSQQRARYHILSPTEIAADFAAHRPRVVIVRRQVLSAATPRDLPLRRGDIFRGSLLADGYILVRSIGGISIYVCCSSP